MAGMLRDGDGGMVFSASDLASHLACGYLTELERAVVAGKAKRPFRDDPGLAVLVERGREHEARYLAALKSAGKAVTEIAVDRKGGLAALVRAVAETEAAMRRGDDVIYQAAFFRDGFLGHADFAVRVEEPSDLGTWSYEPHDTKLARTAKAGALMQLCAYADRIASVQGRTPERVHLVLGGPVPRLESFRFATLAAYYRRIRASLVAVAGAQGEPTFPPAIGYPEPVDHCEVCAWSSSCEARLRADDHLSLVAGISRAQRRSLGERDVLSVAGLARLALPLRPPLERSSPVAVERIREQARIQVEGRAAGTTIAEVIPSLELERGLAALPEPSDGDLFFDIEGDPFARAPDGDRLIMEDGLEYLFGIIAPGMTEDGAPRFHRFWAFDRKGEREAFDQVIDLILAARARHPNMHVFHYAAYEQTALKRLANRYSTRIDELDDLLRNGVFVDLYRVVRQGIRASVESYSIKRLEPLYGFERSVPLRDANTCLREFEAWLELPEIARGDGEARQVLETIERYNRDDCLSAWRLRDWLEERRGELAAIVRVGIPRPGPREDKRSEEAEKRDARVDAVERALLTGVPAEAVDRTSEQQGRWLVAQLLEWHRREDKSAWWEYFDRRKLRNDELIENAATLGGLEAVGPVALEKRSTVYRFRFPPQEHGFDVGTVAHDAATGDSLGEVQRIDSVAGTIEFKRASNRPPPTATGLVPLKIYGKGAPREALLSVGEWVAANGTAAAGPHRAALDLLLRTPPRCGDGPGMPLVRAGEDLVAACVRLGLALREGVLPIQGPPGTGKTHTGAHMIVALIKDGRRVGITANSHRVITNLLDKVFDVAKKEGVVVSAVQKPDQDRSDCSQDPSVKLAEDNQDVVAAISAGANLIAGTSWLWARPKMSGSVDTLFIDEAGQTSLANAVAVASAAPALVLLGDPQQLDQPTKGVHPPGAGASALGHVLDGEKTIADGGGVFLDRTWRLHPDLCAVTSELFYEGRLTSLAGLERQRIDAPGPLDRTGFRIVYVAHQGNQNTSPEEVERVREIYRRLTGDGAAWVDKSETPRPLTMEGVLVVAPYNAHVAALKAALPEGARVGTVDKFQGQEAPVVIYSLASSTAQDAPRGMEFLYNLNRLNVATSRARCLAIVVCSPGLLEVGCKTPRQVVMANGLCRVAEAGG